MTRREKKLQCFVHFAQELSLLSTCTRRLVGAVITSVDLTEVYSIGYNGPAHGLPNDQCVGGEGDCGCVHAEANALVKAARHPSSVLITTVSPCRHCAGLILNTPWIDHVMWLEEYRDPRGVQELIAGKFVDRYRIEALGAWCVSWPGCRITEE